MGTVWYLCQFPSKLCSEVSPVVVFDQGLKVKFLSKYNPPTFHVLSRFLIQPLNSSPGNGPLTGRVERSHSHQSSPKSTIRRAQKREPSNLRGSSTPPRYIVCCKASPSLPTSPRAPLDAYKSPHTTLPSTWHSSDHLPPYQTAPQLSTPRTSRGRNTSTSGAGGRAQLPLFQNEARRSQSQGWLSAGDPRYS